MIFEVPIRLHVLPQGNQPVPVDEDADLPDVGESTIVASVVAEAIRASLRGRPGERRGHQDATDAEAEDIVRFSPVAASIASSAASGPRSM